MSEFLNRLTYLTKKKPETFSNGHGVTTDEDRSWERAYRNRWSHDKIVRSTHGVNCTGSCSWKIYVKRGLKYPMIRGRLMRLWRKAKEKQSDPVLAWKSIMEN